MAEYLILAENITFKNNKLSCINIYDRLSTVAMPAEFRFDMVIICGPNWTEGEHKLLIKAKANNDKEIQLGDLTVNIPHENFVYNALASDIKIRMDYSVKDLTFIVYDNDKEIISRKYPVVSMFIPQELSGDSEEKKEPAETEETENNEGSSENEQSEND